MSNRRCCLCSSKSPEFSLHSFPRDDTLKLWKQICDIRANDNVSGLFVCSKHFMASDYLEPNAKQLGGKLRLKQYRFPTVDVPNPVKIVYEPNPLCDHEPLFEPIVQIDEMSNRTPIKRKYREPRYLSDIKSADFATPRRARTAFRLAEAEVKREKTKNRCLRIQNRRLMKKVTKLQQMFDTLKQTGSLSEDRTEF